MADSKDNTDVVNAILDDALRNLRVSVVVRVDSYDPAERSASVTPMVQEERYLENTRISIPSVSIPGCPVVWPAGSGRSFTIGLNPGDLCLGLYRHRSHDEIDSGVNGPLLPGSVRRVDQSDLIVIPGFVAPASGVDASTYKQSGEPVLAMNENDYLHVGNSSASYYLVRYDLLNQHLSAIRSWLFTHRHLYADGVTEGVSPDDIIQYPLNPQLRSNRIRVDK